MTHDILTHARDPVTLKVVGNSRLRAPIKSSQSPSGMNPCSYIRNRPTLVSHVISTMTSDLGAQGDPTRPAPTHLVVSLKGRVPVSTLGEILFHAHVLSAGVIPRLARSVRLAPTLLTRITRLLARGRFDSKLGRLAPLPALLRPIVFY